MIRHKEDYGNIVLIDSRFGAPKQIEQVSGWLRDSLRVFKSPLEAIEQFKDFFARMKQLNLRPKVAALADVKLDFAEVDEDSDIREAIVDLKHKQAVSISKTSVGTKRTAA